MAGITFEHVSKRFGEETVAVDDLTLDVAEGEFLILVGPSGCGKTTALRMVAGLEEITEGEIRIGGKVVNDLAPTQRDIAMVFQNYALYPHMSVYENVAFPLRQRKLKKAEIRSRVEEAARLLSIEELLQRKPRELSGGQRQRVAIGRALVRRPLAFLMDEPLSNLDAKLRVQMRTELLSLHQRLGITTIYVTHDQTEAMTLGDRVVVMDKGVVQQVDIPEVLYRRPRNTFVAGFIGSPAMNFVVGELRDDTLALGDVRIALSSEIRSRLARSRGAVLAGIRPEDFVITEMNGSAPDGMLTASVEITEQLGPEVLVHFSAANLSVAEVASASPESESSPKDLGRTLVARMDAGFHASRGDRIAVAVRQDRVRLFDSSTGESLLRD
jgi:multiple sugar transport system ATP-binding protein